MSGFERLDRLSLPRRTRRAPEGKGNGNYRHGCRPKESSEWRLRQFGDDLGGLVQRPGERGTAAYKAQTAVGQGIFGNVVGVLCLDDLHHIVVASAQKDL